MPELTTRYYCRHIHLAGHRCGSPALRNENFCYYHHTTRKPAPLHKPHFKIQSLEDRAALQLSLTEVLNRISQGLLDPKTAGLLLYGLQIAANNLPRPTASQPTAETVEDFELTEQNEPVAPVQPFAQAPHERTLEEIFVEQWEQDKQTAALQQAEQAAHRQADSEWIPTLQATTGSQAPETRNPEIQNPETEDSKQETIGYAAKTVATVNIHPGQQWTSPQLTNHSPKRTTRKEASSGGIASSARDHFFPSCPCTRFVPERQGEQTQQSPLRNKGALRKIMPAIT